MGVEYLLQTVAKMKTELKEAPSENDASVLKCATAGRMLNWFAACAPLRTGRAKKREEKEEEEEKKDAGGECSASPKLDRAWAAIKAECRLLSQLLQDHLLREDRLRATALPRALLPDADTANHILHYESTSQRKLQRTMNQVGAVATDAAGRSSPGAGAHGVCIKR